MSPPASIEPMTLTLGGLTALLHEQLSKSNLLFSNAGRRIPKHVFSDYLRRSLSGHPRHIEAIVN